jgi:hypothetical protein
MRHPHVLSDLQHGPWYTGMQRTTHEDATHVGPPLLLLLPLPLPDPLPDEVAVAHAPDLHTWLALEQSRHSWPPVPHVVVD